MSDELRCPFCEQAVEGLTLYLAAGGFRLMVCARCYQVLVSKERQPHSTPMRRLRRVLWGFPRKEVAPDAGSTAGEQVVGYGLPSVADGHAYGNAIPESIAPTCGLSRASSKEVRTHGAVV